MDNELKVNKGKPMNCLRKKQEESAPGTYFQELGVLLLSEAYRDLIRKMIREAGLLPSVVPRASRGLSGSLRCLWSSSERSCGITRSPHELGRNEHSSVETSPISTIGQLILLDVRHLHVDELWS